MVIREMYTPYPIGPNATFRTDATQLGAFYAVTAGTITVVDGAGTTVLNAFPVAAGQVVPLVFSLKSRGQQTSVITLAGGASGTLTV